MPSCVAAKSCYWDFASESETRVGTSVTNFHYSGPLLIPYSSTNTHFTINGSFNFGNEPVSSQSYIEVDEGNGIIRNFLGDGGQYTWFYIRRHGHNQLSSKEIVPQNRSSSYNVCLQSSLYSRYGQSASIYIKTPPNVDDSRTYTANIKIISHGFCGLQTSIYLTCQYRYINIKKNQSINFNSQPQNYSL